MTTSLPAGPRKAGTPSAPASPPAVPTPREVRDMFEDLVVRDLLGPFDGEHETINGRERVGSRYLLGILAPLGTVAHDPERDDPASRETGEDTDGGRAGDTGAAIPVLAPSSFGLTCAVPADTTALKVIGRWGWYRKEKVEQPGEGQHGTIWQRHSIEASLILPLAVGAIPATPLSVGQPGVVVRGQVRRVGSCLLVTLFLVNAQATPQTNKDEAWLFQASLTLEHPDGAAVFIGRPDAAPVAGAGGVAEEDARQLDMLYRHHVEFAVGHGTAVHVDIAPSERTRAIRLATTAFPEYEVPRTEAPTAADIAALGEVVLDMRTLAEMDPAGLPSALTPLVDAYEAWLDAEEARIEDSTARLASHEKTAHGAIAGARKAAARLRAGIALIGTDPCAAAAFQFANRAMWQQRVRIAAGDRRRGLPDREFGELLAEADVPGNRSWRPFQLAFVCVNLPSLTDPAHPERSREDGLVDLLFFPTGGGKTEAYLGLTAYAFAIRRLQGVVEGHDGMNGVAVLMRYTLRLLTADQFKRAAALVCACETIRRGEFEAGNTRLGETPFRIGLWVGMSVSPNKTKAAQHFLNKVRGNGGKKPGGASPLQLTDCPWCGLKLVAGRDGESDPDRLRTLVFCSDPHGACAFSRNNAPKEGLPVVTVDEEIYRLLPALLIATADKFAQLPWQGPVGMLFGRVSGRCERHGFRSPDLDAAMGEANSHPAKPGVPSAKTVPWGPIRPPDLIIQDELHLIAGPLGSMAGLYETAVDHLASWDYQGARVRPKVIASTATVRRAKEQAYALFWRSLEVFPPPVLDVEDSFFAQQRPVSDAAPGRRYRGICAPGVRLKAVEIRVFTTLLSAAKKLHIDYGARADAYMTLVGYFNALRELGGMRRLLDDDVAARLRKMKRRGLANRYFYHSGVQELTSRMSSEGIPRALAQLRVPHGDAKPPKEGPYPIDVLLATNMISVGVDVGRLGLMVAVGQPKGTAEYIQATSRVGRERQAPGIVFTIYNWARPRDLSHFERFEHYHATFYKQVEALSVTPFAPRALDRGLTALLAALVRQDSLRWNANEGAQGVLPAGDTVVEAFIEAVATRAAEVGGTEAGDRVRDALAARRDRWKMEIDIPGRTVGYKGDKDAVYGLLESAGNGRWGMWTVPNSLRETEPTINLIMTSGEEYNASEPAFQFGTSPKGAGAGGAQARPQRKTAEDLSPEEAASAIAVAEQAQREDR